MSPEDDYVDPWEVPSRQPRPKREGDQEVPSVPQIPVPPTVGGIGRARPPEAAQPQSAPPEGFVQNADGSYGVPIPGELAPRVKPPKPEDLEASRRDRDMRNIFLEAVDANARRKYEREFFAFGALPAAENLHEMDRSGRAKTFSDLWAWAQNNIDQDLLPSAEEISKEMVERRSPQGVLKRLRNRAALLLEDLEGYSQKEARSSANAMTAEQAMQRIQNWEDAAQAFADANPGLIGMQRASESFLGPITKATDPFVNMAIESGVPEADRESTVRRARNLARWAVQLRREQGGFLENLSADIIPSLLPQIGSLTAAGRALSGGARKLLLKVSGAFTEATESGIDMLTRRWVMEKLGQGVGLGLQQGAQAYLDPNATGTMAAREAAKSFLAAAAGGAAEDFIMGALGLAGRPRTRFGAGVANAMTELGVDYATAKAYGETYTAEQAVAAALPGLAPWFHAAPKPKPGTPPAAGAPKPTTPPPAPPKATGAPPAPPAPTEDAGKAPPAAKTPPVPAEAGGKPAAPVPAAKAVEGAWEALAPDGSKTELLVQHGPTGTMFKIGGLVNDEGGSVVLAANARGQWTGQDNFSGIPIQMVASLEEGALKLRMFEVQEGGEAPVLIREVAFSRPGAAPAATAPTEAPPAETGGRPPAPPPSTKVPAAETTTAKAATEESETPARKQAKKFLGEAARLDRASLNFIRAFDRADFKARLEGMVNKGEISEEQAREELDKADKGLDDAVKKAKSAMRSLYEIEEIIESSPGEPDSALLSAKAEIEKKLGDAGLRIIEPLSGQEFSSETMESVAGDGLTVSKVIRRGLMTQDGRLLVPAAVDTRPAAKEAAPKAPAKPKRGLGRKRAEAPPTAPPPAVAAPPAAPAAEVAAAGGRGKYDLMKDGIEGEAIDYRRVQNGNEYFEYAIGRVEKGAPLEVFRRSISNRGSYGGWRWETDVSKLRPAAPAEATPAAQAAPSAAAPSTPTPAPARGMGGARRGEKAAPPAAPTEPVGLGGADAAKLLDSPLPVSPGKNKKKFQKSRADQAVKLIKSLIGPIDSLDKAAIENMPGSIWIFSEGTEGESIATWREFLENVRSTMRAEHGDPDTKYPASKGKRENLAVYRAYEILDRVLGAPQATSAAAGQPTGGVGRAKLGKAPASKTEPGPEVIPPKSGIYDWKEVKGKMTEADRLRQSREYIERVEKLWSTAKNLPGGMHSVDYEDFVAIRPKASMANRIPSASIGSIFKNADGTWTAYASVIFDKWGDAMPNIKGKTRSEVIAKSAARIRQLIADNSGKISTKAEKTRMEGVLSWADGLISKYGGEGLAARPETAAPPEALPSVLTPSSARGVGGARRGKKVAPPAAPAAEVAAAQSTSAEIAEKIPFEKKPSYAIAGNPREGYVFFEDAKGQPGEPISSQDLAQKIVSRYDRGDDAGAADVLDALEGKISGEWGALRLTPEVREAISGPIRSKVGDIPRDDTRAGSFDLVMQDTINTHQGNAEIVGRSPRAVLNDGTVVEPHYLIRSNGKNEGYPAGLVDLALQMYPSAKLKIEARDKNPRLEIYIPQGLGNPLRVGVLTGTDAARPADGPAYKTTIGPEKMADFEMKRLERRKRTLLERKSSIEAAISEADSMKPPSVKKFIDPETEKPVFSMGDVRIFEEEVGAPGEVEKVLYEKWREKRIRQLAGMLRVPMGGPGTIGRIDAELSEISRRIERHNAVLPTQPTEGEPGPDVMESLGREEAGSPDERARGAMDELARMLDTKVDDGEVPYIVQTEIDDAEIQIEYDPSKGGELFLRRIESFSPGSGAGTRLLRRVKEVADRFGVSIKLYPDPFGRGVLRSEDEGGPTVREYRAVKSRLVNWYKREGFVRTSGGNLIYRPGAGAEAGPSTMESVGREGAGPAWRNNILDQLQTWQQSGTPQQLLAHLYKARGAKYQAEWIGLDKFLAGKSRVTKTEVEEFVRKYSEKFKLSDEKKNFWSDFRTPGGSNYAEVLVTMPNIPKGAYKDPHFRVDTPPIAVFARKTDRVSANGENVIFVEEIQSDIAASGRTVGRQNERTFDEFWSAKTRRDSLFYKLEAMGYDSRNVSMDMVDEIGDPETRRKVEAIVSEIGNLDKKMKFIYGLPPQMPYETSQKYGSLGLRRIIRMAVDEGKDGIALSSALDQVLRFGTEVVYWRRDKDAPDGSPSFFVRASELEGVAALEARKPRSTLIGDASKFKTIDDVISVENISKWANSYVTDSEDGGDAWDSSGPAQRSTGYDVKSKEDLLRVLDQAFSNKTLPGEDRVKLAEKIWAKMAGTRQGEEGASAPRAEGMKATYDGIYLKEMGELARRFGGEMGKTEIIARDFESPTPDVQGRPGVANPFIIEGTRVRRTDMPDSPPVELASRNEAYQFVARELGLMYDRIERPYLKITPEMAKIVSEGLPQWSMRAEPEGEGIPERPIRPDMGMRELARMAGEHRSAKPLSLRDTYGSDPTPEQRAAHAERVSRWETERDRIRDAMVERVQRGADTSMRTLRDVQATDAVLRRLRDGLITPEAAARQIDAISIEQLARQEMRGAEREGRDRVRGARRAREVLDAAARRGEINEEGADLARWLIDQNPDLYDDLAVTATEAPKGRRGVTAQYDKINRLITLFKGKTNAESAAHEIMHFTEAYLPKDLKEPIRREWRKRLFNEWEKVRDLPVDDPRRQFIESILFYHYQSGGFTESAARRRLRAALQLLVDGAVPESYYEFVNSSEMWAVNSSRLMAERKGMGGGVWAKIKNWYKGMVQRVREILGLRSDAPILRAMDAILSGKGLEFTGEYLSEGREMDRTRGIAGGPKTMASMEADADEGEGEEGPVPKPGRSKKPTSGKLPPVYPMTRETRSTTQLVRDWFGESAGVLRGRAGELGNKITERIKSAIDYGRGIKEQFTDISIGIRKLAENSELVKRLQEPYMHVGWDQTTNSEVPQAYFRYTALLKGWIEPENAAEAEALALLRKLSTRGWNIQADLGANWNYGGIEVPMNRIKEGRSLPNAIMPLLRDLAFDPSHPLRPQAVMEILRATNDMIRRRNEIRRRKMRPDDFIEEPYREYSDVDNFLNRMGEILRSDGEFVSPDGHVAHEFSKDWVIPDLIKIPPGAKYRGGKDGYAPLQQPVLTQRMDGFIDSLAATLGAQIEFGRGELGYDPNRLGPDGKPMGERPKGQFIGASEIDDLREQYVDYYGGKDTGRGQEEGKIFDRAMRTAQGKSFYTSTPRPDIQTPMGVTWAVWDAAKELARTAGLTVSPLLNTVEMVLGPSASESGWFGILKAIAVAPAALADGFSEVFTGKTFTQAGAEAISSGKLNPYAYAYPENIYASGLVGGLKRVNNALRMINSAVNRAQSQQAARMLIEDVGMPEMREKYGANPNDFFNKERMARRLALRAGIDLDEAHNFFNGTMPADRAERILQIARSRTISVLMGENMAAGEVSRFAQLPAVGELFKFYRWHDSFIRRHFKLLQLSMQSGRRGLGRIRAGAPGGVSMTASGAQEMLKTWMFISANAVAAKAIYMAVLASDEEKKREQRAMRRNPEKYWGGMIATQLLAGPVGFIVRTSTDEVIPLGATLPGSVRNIGEGAFDLIWGGAKAVFGDKKGAAQALAGLEQVAPMTKIYTANFTDQGTGRERLRKIQRAEYRDEMKRLKQEEGD